METVYSAPSVTIPGVKYVVNTGKVKVKQEVVLLTIYINSERFK